MGVTAYLELYGSEPFDPGSEQSSVLFGAKGLLPPAWFLFFAPEDFVALRSERDGSDYTLLRCSRSVGLERARSRLAALRARMTPELAEIVGSFVDAIERASTSKSVLVLNSHRFEATRAQLTGCARWFDQVGAKGATRALFERTNELFDPCDGLELDEKQLDVGDSDALCGYPGDGITWVAPTEPEPDQPAPTDGADAALARVWAQPEDLDVRRRCGAELTALGDPRGEFIKLECTENLSNRADKRRYKLLETQREQLGKPFGNVVMFQHGFPLEVEWNGRGEGDPLVGHPAWSTVQSVRYRGPVALLTRLDRVARLHASPELVRELGALGQPVAFRSICMSSDSDPGAWKALESTTVFRDLVEVYVTSSFAVWLPEAAQQLIQCRPALRVNSGSPSLPMRPIAPMTDDEHQQRIARWTKPPPGPFLAGPRYDNGFR